MTLGGAPRRRPRWLPAALAALSLCLLARADELDSARALLAGGNLDEAESWLHKAVQRPHLAAEAHHVWAQLLDLRGNATGAVEQRRVACELAADRADWWLELGQSRQALGQTDDAIAAYNRALVTDPRYATARAALAAALLARGDAEAAEAQYREALLTAPDLEPARQALAALLLDQGHGYEGLKLIQEGLARKPAATLLLGSLGATYEALGETGRALAAYESVARLVPRDPVNHMTVGRLYLARGDPAKAATAYRKAAGLRPTLAAAHTGLAWAYADRKSTLGKAQKEVDQALKLDPEDPGARAASGWVLYRRGSTADGAAALEALAAGDKPSPDASYCLGLIAREAGKRDEALVWLRRAVAAGRSQGLGQRAHELLSHMEAAPLSPAVPPPATGPAPAPGH
jgi:tetratricopeptide (TPR) repeat protein